MDLKEAKKVLEVNKEEKEAIENYKGFGHTAINTLLSITPLQRKEMEKTWVLPSTKEEIDQAINRFVNIYSLMYKKSKEKPVTKRKLYRGTDVDDVNNKNRFLSTAKTESYAKHVHTMTGKPALI